ncbi:MAG: hypothetical protein AAF664_16540, partial [Planctomycetota bacterium]
VIGQRLLRWLKEMPRWEAGVFFELEVSMFVAILTYGAWPAFVLGSVFGGFASAIGYLLWLDPHAERREEIKNQIVALRKSLGSRGYSPLDIEAGLPSLLGTRWAALFEAAMGYEVYRSTTIRLRDMESSGAAIMPGDASVMDSTRRRRDSVTQCITDWSHHHRGFITGPFNQLLKLMKSSPDHGECAGDGREAEHAQYADVVDVDYVHEGELVASDSPSPDSRQLSADTKQQTRRQDPSHSAHDQTRPSSPFIEQVSQCPSHDLFAGQGTAEVGVSKASINAVGLNAVTPNAAAINIQSLQAEHLALHLLESEQFPHGSLAVDPAKNHTGRTAKKEALDQLLAEARDFEAEAQLSPKPTEKEKLLEKYLGDEARLSMALLLGLAFLASCVDSEILSERARGSASEAWSNQTGLVASSLAAASAFPTLELPPGICGWGLLLSSVLMGISSAFRGWKPSISMIIGCLVLASASTLVNCHDYPGELLIGGAFAALAALACAYFQRRQLPSQKFHGLAEA